ncbi:MAG: MBL fold metallo-hydrolase [Oscillospiraceae bacterium]|jgi:glyoxylase-like metal-dependent hydrolase (beta-lactamase superfamily II)|nr:MBL fold metallo-hydrolase [Oscillospiraceae bacterium]
MEVRNIDYGKGKLKARVFFAAESGFSVASVILYGEKEAMVIDTQWTRANAYRVIAEICELGRELKTIFVTHAHPDHYFGTGYFAAEFPGVTCYAPKQTCDLYNTQFDAKAEEWTERIGAMNVCTKHVELIPLPEDNKLYIEGEEVVIYPYQMGDLKYNSLVWIPAIKTVYGSDILFNQAHPFTCEVSKAERALWMKDIELIESLKPEVIIPGHASEGTLFDYSVTDFMRAYLIATEEVLETTKTQSEFFLEMCKRFPDANLVMLSNEMNASVFKGGREWNWREEGDEIDPTKD